MGLEWKSKEHNRELKDDAGTDLMESLKKNWRGKTNSWGCWARTANPVSKERVTCETGTGSPVGLCR